MGVIINIFISAAVVFFFATTTTLFSGCAVLYTYDRTFVFNFYAYALLVSTRSPHGIFLYLSRFTHFPNCTGGDFCDTLLLCHHLRFYSLQANRFNRQSPFIRFHYYHHNMRVSVLVSLLLCLVAFVSGRVWPHSRICNYNPVDDLDGDPRQIIPVDDRIKVIRTVSIDDRILNLRGGMQVISSNSFIFLCILKLSCLRPFSIDNCIAFCKDINWQDHSSRCGTR